MAPAAAAEADLTDEAEAQASSQVLCGLCTMAAWFLRVFAAVTAVLLDQLSQLSSQIAKASRHLRSRQRKYASA